MCAAHANLSISRCVCNLQQRNRFSARVNRTDTIAALFSNKLYGHSEHCGYTLICLSPLEAKDSREVFQMPCCVKGIYSGNFQLAYVGDSFSEVTELKLKPTGMPDRKKTEEVSGNRNKYP